MTTMTICDACGQPIGADSEYVSAMVSAYAPPSDNQVLEPPQQVQLHWHPEHTPDGLKQYEAAPESKGKE